MAEEAQELTHLGNLSWQEWCEKAGYTQRRLTQIYICEAGMMKKSGVTKLIENKRLGIKANVKFDRDFIRCKIAYILSDIEASDNQAQTLLKEAKETLPKIREQQEENRLNKLKEFLESQGYTSDEIKKVAQLDS